MPKKIVNLTPHPVSVISPDGSMRIFPPSGTVARVESTAIQVDTISGIPVMSVKFNALQNLPDPEPGTVFIVSAITAQAAKQAGRSDCVIVNDAVRDSDGRIIGCRSFAVI